MEEEDARLGESTVRSLVARLRTEIGADRCQVMVPQTHPPAAEAEVDFGEFTASIAGQVMKLYMFCMRLSHSGKAFHFAYANQTQESFLDGHVRAFEAFGGVPTGMIRYDNLKPAVIRIALGRERFEHPRFVAMRSHYGYDSFFCAPGIEGAHEKGGVEGEIGRFRRRHLTPMPHVGVAGGVERMPWPPRTPATTPAGSPAGPRPSARRRPERRRCCAPLPAEPFDVALVLSCRVDAKARICVRQSYYSVPARYAGRRLEVRLGATTLTVYDGASIVAEHTRSLHKYSEDLVLDHYLEVLCRKPGALAGSTALAAARASGVFTADHQRFWDAARRRLGDGPGTRALIGVLLLHRTLPADAVIAGMSAAAGLDSIDPDLVAVEARRASHPSAGTDSAAGLDGGDLMTGRRRRWPATTSCWPGSLMTAGRCPGSPSRPLTPRSGGLRKTLQLPTIRAQAAALAAAAAKQRLSHKAFLAEALTAECDERDARRRIRLVHEAKFPRTKRLADFDHSRIPDLTPATLGASRLPGAWIDRGEPLVLLGDSGTGKTHLLIALGTCAAEAGRRVRYLTCAQLVNELAEAADDKQLSRVLGRYARLDLLCLDEVGYLTLDPRGAELLFQIITAREERASIACASNAPFSEWGNTFTDPRLAAAVVDRLTFNAHIIQTGTNSYRLTSTRNKKGAAITS